MGGLYRTSMYTSVHTHTHAHAHSNKLVERYLRLQDAFTQGLRC